MKIYNYHPITKEYINEGKADLSPLDHKKGEVVWLIPANSTKEKPPKPQEGKAIVFNGTSWNYVGIDIVAEDDLDNSSPSTEKAWVRSLKKTETLKQRIEILEQKLNDMETGFRHEIKPKLDYLYSKE